MRTLTLLVLLLAAAPSASADPEAVRSRPNILLILADDLGTDMLRSYGIGQDLPRTPTLDLLAQRSVQFRNAWAAPLCSPTRACIQTGRFGFRTGIGTTVKNKGQYDGLAASEILIPEMLDAGTDGAYEHALFGKWHLNHASFKDFSGAPKGPDVVLQMGYDHHEGIIHNIVAPDSYYDWPKVSNGVKSKSTKYATTETVDDFLAWQQTAPEPWFAVVAFNAPHTPLHAPPSWLHTTNLNFVGPPQFAPRPYFKAMVEAMDAEMGRMFGALGAKLADTSVIFMGDNGTPEPIIAADPAGTLDDDHGKGSAYEGGVNVPLLVSGPRVAAPGTECLALVHAVDIFATVAELAEVDLSNPGVYPPERPLDSLSLVPFLEDPAHPGARRWNYTEKFFANDPSGAQVDESQAVRGHLCGDVLESTGTPGGPRLSICGRPLVENSGNEATIRLVGAHANAPAFLLVGGNNPKPNPLYDNLVTLSPKPLKSLMTVPGNLNLSQPFQTDDSGELVIPRLVYQKGYPVDYYVQVAVQDPATGAWSISDGVQVVQTMNVKAVASTDGYKLITHPSGGPTRLFHLPSDPRERTDLLANGLFALTPTQRAAYDELRAVLAEQLASARAAGR